MSQAGSKSNRGPPDSLFILNAAIDHAKYLKKKLYITFYDYSTCFDSLWLDDCMISLWDIGIRNELFHLIFKLNETTKIRIKTPFGMSDPFQCKRIVKQGSVLSSNICSASTGELCNENTKGYAVIGTTLINDTLYVDDTIDLNTDINETEDSHNFIVNFSKAKRLSINHPKCGTIIINKKTHDSMPSLWIEDDCINQTRTAKVLGDMINEKGDNKDLISDRVKKGNATMVNCLALCNEITVGVHHVIVSLILYNSVFVSTLLFNCQAWTNLLKDDLKRLETIQLKYLKRTLRSPQSTANCFVFLELGMLPVSYIIHVRQLCFLHHIAFLEEDDPVQCIYKEQLSLPYEKNWGNSTQELLTKYDLKDIEPTDFSYEAWKFQVKKHVSQYAFEKLTNEARGKSKTEHLVYTKFLPQPYIYHYHPKTAATIFKIRSRNVECKANRKSFYKCGLPSSDMLCRLCQNVEETQQHIVNCPTIMTDQDPILSLDTIMENDVELGDPNIDVICKRISTFHDKASSEILDA